MSHSQAALDEGPWVVERVPTPDGSELPVIRHARTWVEAPLALRYVLDGRRRAAPGTLLNRTREIARIYNWFAEAGIGFLDDLLTAGHVPNDESLDALMRYMRRSFDPAVVGHITPNDGADGAPDAGTTTERAAVSNDVYNARLDAIVQFFSWAVIPVNHGGRRVLSVESQLAFLTELKLLAANRRLPGGEHERAEPLTPAEIGYIRAVVAPDMFGDVARIPTRPRQNTVGNHPTPGETAVRSFVAFTAPTRLKLHAMVETVLGYGPRVSELLSLKGEHLLALLSCEAPSVGKAASFPAGQIDSGQQVNIDTRVVVPRQRNAPEDPRVRDRPRGKTIERAVPALWPSSWATLRAYVTLPPSLDGRVSDGTAYVFTTNAAGRPMSRSEAVRLLKQLGEYGARLAERDVTLSPARAAAVAASLRRLTWHRLRHTWAEQAAFDVYSRYGAAGFDRLEHWGGWRSRKSMLHYTQYARRRMYDAEARAYFRAFDDQGERPGG